MNLSRRALLFGVSTVALLGLTACNTDVADTASIERVITAHFGAEIARTNAAKRFAADFTAHMATNPVCQNPWIVCTDPETRIVQAFLESTTYLAAEAGVADFDYVTIYHPLTAACASQLVAPIG
jgi:hypothetical protein